MGENIDDWAFGRLIAALLGFAFGGYCCNNKKIESCQRGTICIENRTGHDINTSTAPVVYLENP